MLDQLDELYRDVILDHFAHPTHTGELPDAQIKADGDNPLCGDALTFHIQVDDGRLARVRFRGKGCAISQAAASMLAGTLEGKPINEARRIVGAMKALMQGEPSPSSVDLGDLEALSGVRKFPIRVKCAALSWNVVERGLEEYGHGRH